MQKKVNKYLLYILILLIPITIISFFKKETNFIIEEKQQSVDNIFVPVELNDKIIEVNLEDYIIGVIAGEMPASFENEALKAQAVASRTYVINHLQNNSSISSTIDDQVYLTETEMKEKWNENYEKYYAKIKEAVKNTEGLIMYYENKPIKAYYYSMSNGYTESSLNVFNEQTEYLTIISSPFDENNSYTINISKKDFCSALNIPCLEIIVENIIKNESERVSKITINNKEFTGIQIREKLSLRSTDFTILVNENNVTITTKGYGHGVGMSQYGANYMALDGYKYDEILKYYYQNIEISSI